jgi:hypothetical protein
MFNSLWMYTMNRCLVFSLFSLCLATAAQTQAQLSEPLPVPVQTGTPGLRNFPQNAVRGTLRVVQTPEILIDGKRERLSPGSRIRDTQNRLLMSASITNENMVVNFVRNSLGEVHEVWVLTEAEARQKSKRNTPERNFTFASEGEGALKQDDGKTPFNQLPSFEQQGRQQRSQAQQSQPQR